MKIINDQIICKLNEINAAITLISLGIIARCWQYFYNRSLWIDEAMLANSICTRTFSELCSTPLAYSQSAPIGYLYIVKIFTIVFGQDEWVLRFPSLLAGIGVVFMAWFMAKNIFQLKYHWIAPLLISLNPSFIRYSNELKPYMLDILCIFVVITLHHFYKKNMISDKMFFFLLLIITWFSFPVLFFIGGILLLECLIIIKEIFHGNGRKKDYKIFFLGIFIIFINLLMVYLIWLMPAVKNIDHGSMDYWKFLSFPLFPSSLYDLKLLMLMVKSILSPLGRIGIVVCFIGFSLGVVYFYKHNKHLFMGIFFSFLLLLIASSMGKYPIESRLVLFISAIIMSIASIGFNDILNKKLSHEKWAPIVLILIVLISNYTFPKYFFAKGVYNVGSEVHEHISYIHKHGEEKIYVHSHAIPIFSYENLKCFIDDKNVIFGSHWLVSDIVKPYQYHFIVDEERLNNDVRMIEAYQNVLIFTSHLSSLEQITIAPLIHELEKSGTVEVVQDHYNTYLLRYQKF